VIMLAIGLIAFWYVMQKDRPKGWVKDKNNTEVYINRFGEVSAIRLDPKYTCSKEFKDKLDEQRVMILNDIEESRKS
jgi:hypothetical protein